jgi:hypothetical protein
MTSSSRLDKLVVDTGTYLGGFQSACFQHPREACMGSAAADTCLDCVFHGGKGAQRPVHYHLSYFAVLRVEAGPQVGRSYGLSFVTCTGGRS